MTFPKRLERTVDTLEHMGENDMGDLTFAQARKFHNAVAALRLLAQQSGGARARRENAAWNQGEKR